MNTPQKMRGGATQDKGFAYDIIVEEVTSFSGKVNNAKNQSPG